MHACASNALGCRLRKLRIQDQYVSFVTISSSRQVTRPLAHEKGGRAPGADGTGTEGAPVPVEEPEPEPEPEVDPEVESEEPELASGPGPELAGTEPAAVPAGR